MVCFNYRILFGSLHSHHQSSVALYSFQLLKIQMKMSIVAVSSIDGNIRAINSISMNHFFYYALLKPIKKFHYSWKILLCDSIHSKAQQFYVAIFHKQPTAFRCELRIDTLCVRSVSFKRKVHLNFGVVKANEFGDLFLQVLKTEAQEMSNS